MIWRDRSGNVVMRRSGAGAWPLNFHDRDSRLKPLVETRQRLDAKHESDGSRSEIAQKDKF